MAVILQQWVAVDVLFSSITIKALIFELNVTRHSENLCEMKIRKLTRAKLTSATTYSKTSYLCTKGFTKNTT